MKRPTLLPGLLLDLPRVRVGVPGGNFKQHIDRDILSTWWSGWNGAVKSKLRPVMPVLGDWQSSYRKDEVCLCRARVDHTHLSHSYILRKDSPSQCEHCRCVLAVRRILVECNYVC